MRKILFTVLLCTSVLNLHCSKIRERKVPEFMTAKRPTPELVYQCAKHGYGTLCHCSGHERGH